MNIRSNLRIAFAALVVVTLASAGIAGATHGFRDVGGGMYYSDAVEWAYNTGVTTGTSPTTFEPDTDVTRGQNVTFLYRYDHNIVQPALDALEAKIKTTVGPAGPAGTDAQLPAGTVIFYNGTTCPAGWSAFTAAEGRVVVGLTTGGTLAGTSGDPLTDLESLSHGHSVNPPATVSGSAGSHSHDFSSGGPTSTSRVTPLPLVGTSVASNSHIHSGTTGTDGYHSHSTDIAEFASSDTATDTVLPYVQLLTCVKN